MIIQKKRIRNVVSYLASVPEDSQFRPAVRLTGDHEKKLKRLGFTLPVSAGHTILPKPCGAVSRYNADGGWLVHRDEPKEERYITTVRWRWKQWAAGGSVEECEDFRDVYRKCFPRTEIPAPGLELTYMERDGQPYLVGPVLHNTPKNHVGIRHAINLLLELAGECELLQADLSDFASIKVKRLNWQLLPPGSHPWPRLESHLRDGLKRSSDGTQTVILDRQKTIMSFGPDEQYVGSAGFSDYIALSDVSANGTV